MELSERLQAVASLVTPGNRVADVGCDHGLVPIYLYEKGISPKIYAMDVRKGPLSRAEEHIAKSGLRAYIETRLSDGLEALKAGEADTLIIAGMGGRLMADILKRGREKVLQMQECILQPQSDLAYFRHYLRECGYRTVEENMVKEDGKFYPMMKVCPKNPSPAGLLAAKEQGRIEDRFGGLLLQNRHPVLREYLLLLRKRDEQILKELIKAGNTDSEKTGIRKDKLSEELSDIEKALAWFDAAG